MPFQLDMGPTEAWSLVSNIAPGSRSSPGYLCSLGGNIGHGYQQRLLKDHRSRYGPLVQLGSRCHHGPMWNLRLFKSEWTLQWHSLSAPKWLHKVVQIQGIIMVFSGNRNHGHRHRPRGLTGACTQTWPLVATQKRYNNDPGRQADFPYQTIHHCLHLFRSATLYRTWTILPIPLHSLSPIPNHIFYHHNDPQ